VVHCGLKLCLTLASIGLYIVLRAGSTGITEDVLAVQDAAGRRGPDVLSLPALHAADEPQAQRLQAMEAGRAGEATDLMQYERFTTRNAVRWQCVGIFVLYAVVGYLLAFRLHNS
jgi:hypothetical protein